MSKTADGKDGTEKVMAVPPYYQETCYPLSSFQAPHEPWYEQPIFNPVQLGYGGYGWAGWLPNVKLIIHSPWLCLLFMLNVRVLLFTMDGHRTTLREHPMKVAELVVKS